MLKNLVFLMIFLMAIGTACADTIYLKNGRSIDGVIKNEDQDSVELDIGIGSVKFQRSEINSIERSSSDENQALRSKLENPQRSLLVREYENQSGPRRVEFSRAEEGIVVGAKLNGKTSVSLILDTGASMTMLRPSVAQSLGISLENVRPDMILTLADGRTVPGKRIVLESVKVQNVEAENIEAAILLQEAGEIGRDGLLGMSFLKNFKFKVDYQESKLTLERY